MPEQPSALLDWEGDEDRALGLTWDAGGLVGRTQDGFVLEAGTGVVSGRPLYKVTPPRGGWTSFITGRTVVEARGLARDYIRERRELGAAASGFRTEPDPVGDLFGKRA